jgi:hypothetical protein
MVLLLLLGSSSLMALGATKVEVSIKKINNKNTRSDMEAVLKPGSLLFRICIAITIFLFSYSVSPFLIKFQKNKSQKTNKHQIQNLKLQVGNIQFGHELTCFYDFLFIIVNA